MEQIEKAGFPRKVGASYVWGEQTEPWTLEFFDLSFFAREHGELTPAERAELINRHSSKFFDAIGASSSSDDSFQLPGYSWQVERAKYDKILLDHA